MRIWRSLLFGRKRLVLACLLCLWAVKGAAEGPQVDANMLLRDYYVADPKEKRVHESRLLDIEQGIEAANTYLRFKKEEPIYCLPVDLVFTGSEIIEILSRAVKKDPILGRQPFRIATLMALQLTFPCPSNLR
jgi:hypothetical protein